MSRGRHAQPAPPRSDKPLLVLALLVAVAVVAAIWVVDDTWALQAGVTGIVLLALIGIWAASRSSTRATEQLWRESLERRRDLADTHRELDRTQVAARRAASRTACDASESALAAQEAARLAAQAASDEADQRALMRQLTQPRQPALDPVYPSLHALGAGRVLRTETRPARPDLRSPTVRRHRRPHGVESTPGGEPLPPRQLLDLTASARSPGSARQLTSPCGSQRSLQRPDVPHVTCRRRRRRRTSTPGSPPCRRPAAREASRRAPAHC